MLTETAGDLEKEAGQTRLKERLVSPLVMALARILREAEESTELAERLKMIVEVGRQLTKIRREGHHAERVRMAQEQWAEKKFWFAEVRCCFGHPHPGPLARSGRGSIVGPSGAIAPSHILRQSRTAAETSSRPRLRPSSPPRLARPGKCSRRDGNLVQSLDTKKRITQPRLTADGKRLIISGATGQPQPKDKKWPSWRRVQVCRVEV